MNKNFIFLNEVDSTNNYANQLVVTKAAEEGTVVLAQFQKSGKGQKGNTWESEAGKNLLASFILHPVFLKAADQFYISKIISLSIAEILQSKTKDITIKWPNDIYVGNRKIAGILIENSVLVPNIETAIAGIGLNLNQEIFVSDAPNPVSLKQLTGKDYEIQQFADDLFVAVEKWYGKLQSCKFTEIDTVYHGSLFRMKEWAHYSADGKIFEAKIIGTGKFGQLQLEHRDGKITEHFFKEVEFVI
jgi:BirA family biotin operon repressor/biotin-[acetyl-CoA-carboxylase] ligase